MPRALAIRHVTVPDDARAAYLARAAERQASARACGYGWRTFARDGDPRRYVECIEAGGRAALDAALAQDALFAESLDWRLAPAGDDAPPEIYLEVEQFRASPE